VYTDATPAVHRQSVFFNEIFQLLVLLLYHPVLGADPQDVIAVHQQRPHRVVGQFAGRGVVLSGIVLRNGRGKAQKEEEKEASCFAGWH